jgi:hypothetical protein
MAGGVQAEKNQVWCSLYSWLDLLMAGVKEDKPQE